MKRQKRTLNDIYDGENKPPRKEPRRDPREPKKDDRRPTIIPIRPPQKPNDNKRKRSNSSDSEESDDVNFDDLFSLLFMGGPPGQGPKRDENSKKQKIDEQECKNPLCDHKTLEEDPTPVLPITVQTITDINDLIILGKSYHCKKNREINGINLRILCNLVTPLTELQKLIGMKSVKEHIVNQILFFVRGYNKQSRCNNCIDCSYKLPCARNNDEMLHTVITGPPGIGKTMLGKILGQVYKEMGILEKGTFRLVTRSDLIGKYLGHTAKITQEVIDSCKGGVMFIDEAYALGHSEGRDSFSKECLDTLNQNLSERRDFLCIIAGYADQLEECFFKMNEGLRRRFTFRYDIQKYSYTELKDIFEFKAHKDGWTLCYEIEAHKDTQNEVLQFFRNNNCKFPNYGGDMETLLLNCKIAHSRNLSTMGCEFNRVLTIEDLRNGFKSYVDGRRYDKQIKDVSEWETSRTSIYKD